MAAHSIDVLVVVLAAAAIATMIFIAACAGLIPSADADAYILPDDKRTPTERMDALLEGGQRQGRLYEACDLIIEPLLDARMDLPPAVYERCQRNPDPLPACPFHLVETVRAADGATACVWAPTLNTLRERGWAAPPDSAAATRDAIRAETTTARGAHGLPPLARDPALDLIAQMHAEDMAARNYHSHTTLDSALGPAGRASQAGYDCFKDYGVFYTRGVAENIAWRSPGYYAEWQGAHFVETWMESPGHRENILDPSYDRMGVGVAVGGNDQVFGVQNFC